MGFDLARDEMLSTAMRCRAYRITIIDSADDRQAAQALADALKDCGADFAFCKVPVSQVDTAIVVQRAGFLLVDTNIGFEKRLSDATHPPPPSAVGCRLANAADEPRVLSIAESAFRFSRFHLDPAIPKAIADNVKRVWVSNFFNGTRGDALIVAEERKEPIGFLLLLDFNEPTVTIDLIATAPAQERRGIASAMLAFAEAQAPAALAFRVGTQVANIPSVRLYEKLNYRLISAHYVFHYHPA